MTSTAIITGMSCAHCVRAVFTALGGVAGISRADVSIGRLFLAGVIPGVLMGVSLMIAVYIYAKKRNYPVYPRATLREFGSACLHAILRQS